MKTKMPELSYVGIPRFICTVLEEMRTCIKTLNFSYLPSLIEEAQMLASRMEGALGAKHDIRNISNDLHNLKAARKSLIKEVDDLIKKRDKIQRRNNENK